MAARRGKRERQARKRTGAYRGKVSYWPPGATGCVTVKAGRKHVRRHLYRFSVAVAALDVADAEKRNE